MAVGESGYVSLLDAGLKIYLPLLASVQSVCPWTDQTIMEIIRVVSVLNANPRDGIKISDGPLHISRQETKET